MFKALKMKIAARRMERRGNKKRTSTKKSRTTSRRSSFWPRVWNAVCVPFRAIGRWCRAFWKWVRSIDLIGLVNITLLSAIIVLFSIDIIGCKKPVVIIAKNNEVVTTHSQATDSNSNTPRIVRERDSKRVTALPIRRDENRVFTAETINVARVQPDNVAIKQTARCGKTMYGDVIIDSRGAATMLKPGDVVKGNLFLQHMRKYTLPRGVRIEGHLFLRDMGMLQFGGEFTVTGNIYVTPTSSFGPIPGTARIGGQVIL